MQSKKVIGKLKLTIQRAELEGEQLEEFTHVYVQLIYKNMMSRTQSAMNKDKPNFPEWSTTINIDIFDENDAAFITVNFYLIADQVKIYTNSKIKFADWCAPEKPTLGYILFENGAGKLFLSSLYERTLPNPEVLDCDATMQNQSESGNLSDSSGNQ